MALVKTTAQVIIASGASLSNPIDLGSTVLCAILIPASWTAAGLSFQASDDGGTTWFNVFDSTGAEVTVGSSAVVAGQRISINPASFVGVDFIRVRSGTSAAPVNQAAARTLTLVSVDSAQAVGVGSATASGGTGSQTPWTTDVDAANHQLTGLNTLAVSQGPSPAIYIVKAPDTMLVNPSTVMWETNAIVRWATAKLNTESTGNAGSDLVFSRYDDTGNWLGNPVIMFRASGAVAFNNSVGIGTTNPQATLDVVGTVRFGSLPNTAPAAGSKQIWYDPADGNRVKFMP